MLNKMPVQARTLIMMGVAIVALSGCATREEVNRAIATAERAEGKADQAIATANAANGKSDRALSTAEQALSAAQAAQRDTRAVDEKVERMYQRGLRKEQ